jgi:hypothetical protein
MTVTVSSTSTSPTSISNAASICSSGNTVLTAVGGTEGAGSYYQWGTGFTLGSGIIPGETTSSITVNPLTSTTYWVRRIDPAPCNRITGGATITVSIPSTAPTAITGPSSLCYTDGGAFLVAGGGISGTNSMYQWGTGTVIGSGIITTSTISSLYINPMVPTTYWVRRYDPAPCNQYTGGVFFHVNATTVSTSPTAIAGVTTICLGTSTTLTATGGVHGSGAYYQWGTGYSVGDNIIAGENGSSITVSPTGNTIYWVRRVDAAPCNRLTYGPTVLVTVPSPVTYSAAGWSGLPNITTPIIVTASLDVTSDMQACSCQIMNNAVLKIFSGATLTVQRNVSVATTAQLIAENSASLVQKDDASTFTGVMTVKRNSAPMKLFDYSYWSAPVTGWTLNQLSPLTLSDKYYSFSPTINNWVSIAGGAQMMTPSKGYIVRAPQGWSLTNPTSGVYNATFVGTANNGIIPIALTKSASSMNLIGNPYPSAIDIDQFLLDAVNSGVINGTVYLWTHNTAISSLIPGNWVYNYTADDYAKYNLTGGVQSASSAITGGTTPTGKIASGQAFFIEVNSSLPPGTYTAYFRNAMRLQGNNTEFYKSSVDTVSKTAYSNQERGRVWLSMSNSAGAYSQLLLGYLAGATNAFDSMYDGKIFSAGNNLTFYTNGEAGALSIEGRALPFNDTQVIPLAYNTTAPGNFTIGIDKTDGLFTGHGVYLHDKLTGIMHDLTTGSYTFFTTSGVNQKRFELKFRSDFGFLGSEPAIGNNKVDVYKEENIIQLHASVKMSSIVIYDLQGRTLFTSRRLRDHDFVVELPYKVDSALLLKVTLENGSVISKKIL